MKKKYLVIILVFASIMVSGQNSFVLIDLQPNESFIYREIGTQRYIQYNITDQISLQTSGLGQGIYANVLETNDSSSLNIVNAGVNITTNTLNYKFQFGDLYNSTFLNSAKGNMLINGSETRDFSIFYPNGTNLLTGVATFKVEFDIADRAITLLTGNPAFDFFTLQMTYNTTEYKVELRMWAEVSYDVSQAFQAVYQGQNVTVKNITETYRFTETWISINHLNSSTGFFEEFIFDRFEIQTFENIYSFAQEIQLPIYIEKLKFTQQAQQKINAIQQQALGDTIEYDLNTFSWDTSDTSDTSTESQSESETVSSISVVAALVTLMIISRRHR